MPPFDHSKKLPKNPYLDQRESKIKKIERSLVHKARLRKNYFKELERSGESVPEKQSRNYDEGNSNKRQTYQDRAKLVKERKQNSYQQRDQARKEKEKLIERKKEDRLKNKERLSEKTRSGQPLMGPRIENLLDKIKKDYT